MTDRILYPYKNTIELIQRIGEFILKESKNPKDLETVEQLVPYLSYFENEIKMTEIRDKIFTDFDTALYSTSQKHDCDSIINQFNEEIAKAYEEVKNGEKSKNYIDFMKMIQEYSAGDEVNDDSEIKTISETVSTLDPITKRPIVEPVKNKKCGHVYDKTSIIQLLEQNPKTKCPIPGCNATNFVKKSDLVPDSAMKRMLAYTNTNSQKKLKLDE